MLGVDVPNLATGAVAIFREVEIDFEKGYGACNGLGRAEYIQKFRKLFWRYCAPAFGDPFADMVPIGVT